MSKPNHKSTKRKSGLLLKKFRTLHRTTAAFLFAFFFIVAVSGLTLGWKKHAGNLIMPETQKSEVVTFAEWKDLSELEELAQSSLKNHLLNEQSYASESQLIIDRIDIRKSKGIAKFLFEQANWEVQISGSTGQILSIGKRHSDWIETLHDGSIIDSLIGESNGYIKLLYTNIMGIGLLIFTLTGFWMWYGPKRKRASLKEDN